MNKHRKQLRRSLELAIREWADNVCETQAWNKGFDAYVGDNFTNLMTDAAFAVLVAIRDVQVLLGRDNGVENMPHDDGGEARP